MENRVLVDRDRWKNLLEIKKEYEKLLKEKKELETSVQNKRLVIWFWFGAFLGLLFKGLPYSETDRIVYGGMFGLITPLIFEWIKPPLSRFKERFFG